MARVALNVLLFPFRRGRTGLEYALFRRSDEAFWQGVAGGAEDGETPWEAARRELLEEAGIGVPPECWITLDARNSVPATVFPDWAPLWGPGVFVVHVHAFGVDASRAGPIALSAEHTESLWLDFERASALMRYDQTALWELNQRLTRAMTGSSA